MPLLRPDDLIGDQFSLLDLCCGAGACSMGYAQAGFEIFGVDKELQPHYPFPFMRADALLVARELLATGLFDAVHASPPCQRWTRANTQTQDEWPDLITPLREIFIEADIPYVIENVVEAPLLPGATRLCGRMFPGLKVYRHRQFETNWPLMGLNHPHHDVPCAPMGKKPKPGEFIHVVGNFTDVEYAREAMGISWMTRNEIREAIPPAYTRFIGRQLASYLASFTTSSRAYLPSA